MLKSFRRKTTFVEAYEVGRSDAPEWVLRAFVLGRLRFVTPVDSIDVSEPADIMVGDKLARPGEHVIVKEGTELSSYTYEEFCRLFEEVKDHVEC